MKKEAEHRTRNTMKDSVVNCTFIRLHNQLLSHHLFKLPLHKQSKNAFLLEELTEVQTFFAFLLWQFPFIDELSKKKNSASAVGKLVPFPFRTNDFQKFYSKISSKPSASCQFCEMRLDTIFNPI